MLRTNFRMARRSPAFTLVELLVVIAIIGVLVALLLPAVQAARESARAAQCTNHLKQIGLATLHFNDTYNMFPPARLRSAAEETNTCETTQASWLVRIMPYLEEGDHFAQWNVYNTFEDHPPEVREYTPAVYICPTRRSMTEAVIPSSTVTENFVYSCGHGANVTIKLVGGAVGDYGANHGDFTGGADDNPTDYYYGGNGTGVIVSSRPICTAGKPSGWSDKIRMKDLTDGVSKTFLAGEMHVPLGRIAEVPENGPIYNGSDLVAFARIGGPGIPLARAPTDVDIPIIGFGSWHPGVCPFVLADGSVESIGNFVDTEVLREFCNRADAGNPPVETEF